MKTIFAFCLFLSVYCCSFGQHPLFGTWEMVSIKGINADGERFSADTSTIREFKVITATHYMLIAHDVGNDTLVFNRCYFGAVQLEGDKYNEIPILSSVPIFENVKTDFTWKVIDDRFIQSGTLIRPDGKKIILDELIFRRVSTAHTYSKNAVNGTWKLLKSTSVAVNGETRTDTNESVSAYQLITPTHWMYISARNKKFEHAMGGSYSMKGDKYFLNLDVSTFSSKLWGKTEMTQKVAGDKLHTTGVIMFDDGRKLTWNDLFEKAR